MTNDFIYKNDFGELNMEIPLDKNVWGSDELIPRDIKRIIKHCDHTFLKRYYFISESTKQIYRFIYNEFKQLCINKKQGYITLISDNEKHTNIYATNNLFKRIKEMKIIELERMCSGPLTKPIHKPKKNEEQPQPQPQPKPMKLERSHSLTRLK